MTKARSLHPCETVFVCSCTGETMSLFVFLLAVASLLAVPPCDIVGVCVTLPFVGLCPCG